MEPRNPDCPCKNVGCDNHGLCDACRERHHAHGGLTACERQAEQKS